MIIQSQARKDLVSQNCTIITQTAFDNDEMEQEEITRTPLAKADSTSKEFAVIANKSCDDSEEEDEKELTNLNWLLRNQTIAWPNAINVGLEDEVESQYNCAKNIDSNSFLSEPYDNLQQNLQPNAVSVDLNDTLRVCGRIPAVAEKSKVQQLQQHNAPSKRPTPTERYDIFVNKIKRDLKEYEKSSMNYKNDITEKPPFNYSHIIGMAMLENGRVTLQQICTWIESKFAFFRVRKKWNNSIRHNLSLHHCFRKIDRRREEKGKGGYWELGVDPRKCDRKRIRNRSKSAKAKNAPKSYSSVDIVPLTPAPKGQPLLTCDLLPQDRHDNDDHIEADIAEIIVDDMRQICDNPADGSCMQMSNSSDFNVNSTSLDQVARHIDLNDISLANLLSNAANGGGGGGTFYAEMLPTSADAEHNSARMQLQQQYELGTIVISTNSADNSSHARFGTDIKGSATDITMSSFNGLINDAYNQPYVVYTEDEVPSASDDIIISSYLTHDSDVMDEQLELITNSNNVLVQHLTQQQPLYSMASTSTATGAASSTSISTSMSMTTSTSSSASTAVSASTSPMTESSHGKLTVNCDYSSTLRPYVDGIDEAFQYLHSIEINRSEDTLDNLLDVCINDY